MEKVQYIALLLAALNRTVGSTWSYHAGCALSKQLRNTCIFVVLMQMRTDPHVSAVKYSNAFVKAVTTELMRLSEIQAAVEEQRAVLGY